LSKRNFADLVELMARLRAPDGCPWDRKQDHRSLRTHLLEETYEALDAIDAADDESLQDELGDVLLQVLFHAQIAREAGRFTIDDVLTRLHEKLIRRHPHVFGDSRVHDPEAALARWEALKAEEREANGEAGPEGDSLLNGIPRSLPALLVAAEMTRRAARVGFDWSQAEEVLAKLEEEVEEVRGAVAAGDGDRLEDEVGDLLFVVVNLARKLGQDPEIALRRTNLKFLQRFRAIEEELSRQGKSLEEATLEEMDALWEQSKKKESGR
jgi:tetrapyrrole methylase family protein/MazG family protein